MKGTVIKRGGKWSVVLDLGTDPTTRKRIRKWHSGYATKKEAERAQVELLHNVASGQYVEPTKETLGAFLERWLRAYVATNVAPQRAQAICRNRAPARHPATRPDSASAPARLAHR